jgi:Fic family protein
LRRSNRIKTIYSSLAIEQNTLSLNQVTAVVSGKRVLAPPKDIAEVQNAFEIYDRLDELDPYSIDDLLAAHSVMVRGLRDDAGEFRSRPVGVVDSQGNILHFGTLPAYVPQLVAELLYWTEHADSRHAPSIRAARRPTAEHTRARCRNAECYRENPPHRPDVSGTLPRHRASLLP